MSSPISIRPERRTGRLGTTLIAALAIATSAVLATVVLTFPSNDPAAAATTNPITPGTFKGRGFDQCNAPTQRAMNAWLAKSPYRAVGIYISGASRFCREQPNLTPTWVSTQLRKGWRLLPITLGPQPSCLSRFPRYGATIDPTVNPDPTNTYAKARAQGRLEATRAVDAAKRLGIVPGSTLFYDMEGWNIKHSARCNNSALWFMSAWTVKVRSLGYASGVYSSAGSGIVLLDRARRSPLGAGYRSPDQLWIARWDGKANTSTTYISDEGWKGQRIKQYLGGHNETHGGVTINIDSNYLDVRTPKLPGTSSPNPSPSPSPSPSTSQPAATTGTSDPKCTSESISKRLYRVTSATRNTRLIVPLQCLLKQQGLYNRVVTGTWNSYTTIGLKAFQKRMGHPQRTYVTRSDWVSFLTRGASDSSVRQDSRGADVIRVQRALNAATSAQLPVTGYFGAQTRSALVGYQKRVLGSASGVVGSATWKALHRGRM